MSGQVTFETFDVFTSQKFHGNPLAVVREPAGGLSQADKQKIAQEFNLSETTFVRSTDEAHAWDVGIFTSSAELPFAGHPTIGTISYLALQSASAGEQLKAGTLRVKAGPIPFTVDQLSAERASASAEVPHNVHVHSLTFSRADLEARQPALKAHLAPEQQSFPIVSITKGMTFIPIELPSMDALGSVAQAQGHIEVPLDAEFSPSFVGCYYFFRESVGGAGARQRIFSRMMETHGEDAVTGSAACCLSAWLAMRFFGSAGSDQRRAEFRITQGVHMGRPGTATVTVEGNAAGKVERMVLSGEAVRLMSGAIDLS